MARLRNASKRGIEIIVVFGVDNGNSEIINELLEMENCKVYFKEYLHAKFYYNEKELLIGSMNLSESSAKNNFELGVKFDGEEYKDYITKVKEEAKEIIEDAIDWPKLKKSNSKGKKTLESKSVKTLTYNDGFCIRCDTDIAFNPQKPLCPECYQSWYEWENPDYIEEFCHSCGKEKEFITFNAPECYHCYKKNRQIKVGY
jgi:hypothetical protein